MFFYLGIFILIMLLSLGEIITLTRRKQFFLIAIVLLALVAGLRYKTGYDFASYEKIYDSVQSFSDVFNKNIPAESGYLFSNYIFKVLGLDFYTFILSVSFVIMFTLGYFLWKNTNYPTLVILYYYSRFFFLRDMAQMRSAFVSVLCLYSLKYFRKRDLKKVVLISLIGSLFHVVSLFLIPAYLVLVIIDKVDFRKESILLLLSGLMGMVFFFPSLLLTVIPQRYADYFSGENVGGKWILNPVFIMQVGILFFCTILIKRDKKESEKYNTVLGWYLISTCLLIAFGPLFIVSGRMSTVFATSEIFVVPLLFSKIFKNKLLSIAGYYCFCLAIFFLTFVISGVYKAYIPYNTIFF
ncbi:EpsG family protein [Enterococcus hulanensis]|uniref:EpsG family protein n=1 Tax=Enterococcus hulanensis TaxID=2559929 RepID=UPI001A921EC9|nr:EpsG family protein [Enterococcus hulanensis]MBO0411988.1 EpsG family protein [Enterococcus hulanensis]